ncbi:sulfite reductase subunit beta [Candidatus Pantoea edessiphila]|uniref:Sulfite reductase [NADPH] hemoprotein beta-component n=1 Tax=Candidatus Pantoea edessiphila TaxID=2044610 RepID=A0A2P5SXM9_9GAMM|nr:assimilatory sulfite reductase (NADPH) hemoprotein subunit [Candidatus Pantoea edessiphila]MBK4775684.1 assimilatory sulfite reductase (NADPH) hemoprotein subunit [Pantoea sp. Edef]PPI87085.1 sulfite reductase subunit beta [Candidatus Pantoea edessiphila]
MNEKDLNSILIIKGKLEDAERVKEQSNYLRGTIVQDLENEITGGFTGDNFLLIRFHGMYQQDNRDIRAERIKQKLEPLHSVMLRCRLPGGVITTEQWLAIDNFASTKTTYGSIRLTNRQTFQLHGILKKNIKSTHKMLHQIGLDSLATANDVNRNILCTSNPLESNLHKKIFELAKKLSEHLLPRTKAYAEIWLDKNKIVNTDIEPILGKTYLPRKFKITLVIPPHNDVDLHANDLNFIAIVKNEKLIGFNLLIGGGLSLEHGNKNTYPRTATDFGFFPYAKVLDVATAVITIQRDWGDRTNRKNAKTKYTIERVGIKIFKKEIESRSGVKLQKSIPYQLNTRGDRIGWIKGIDKKWHLTLFIQNGRIIDSQKCFLKKGIAEIAKVHQGYFRITANQNIIIAGVSENKKNDIESIALKYGLMANISSQRKNSMACVSFPTCPLAMAEAERFLPNFLTKIEKIMQSNGVGEKYIVLRVTGCPNGCGRAMLAEIGLVGKALGRYNLHIGGNRIGTRIARMYRENINEIEIISHISKLIEHWAKESYEEEDFGDFVIRVGIIKPVLDPAKDFWE